MKNINYRKNEILKKNLFKVFCIFLNEIEKNDIIILKIKCCNMRFIQIFYYSKTNCNLSKLFFFNKKKFFKIINTHLSIIIPKFVFLFDKDKFDIINNNHNIKILDEKHKK